MLLLLHVVVPVRTWWLPFSNSFTFFVLPCGFTSTDEFVLRQLLHHDGMNMLS
jgi:hypothetical protein